MALTTLPPDHFLSQYSHPYPPSYDHGSQTIHCQWDKPEPQWIKLNTDGSLNARRMGLGGVVRDERGMAVWAFSQTKTPTPETGVFVIELKAIYKGLKLVKSAYKVQDPEEVKLGEGSKKIRARIWVESDSKGAVVAILRGQQLVQNPAANRLVLKIWNLLDMFDDWRVSHIFRQANSAADFLSKMYEFSGEKVVMEPNGFPRALKRIIDADAKGKFYPRQCQGPTFQDFSSCQRNQLPETCNSPIYDQYPSFSFVPWNWHVIPPLICSYDYPTVYGL